MTADVKFEAVAFGISNASVSSTIDIEIPNFGRPKAAMFFAIGGNFRGGTASDPEVQFGFTDGTNRTSISSFNYDGVTTSVAACQSRQDCVISGLNSSKTRAGRWDFNAWLENGVQLIVDEAFNLGNNLEAFCVLWGGEDLAEVYVGTENLNDVSPALGTKSVTSPGFEPDLIFAAINKEISSTTDADYSFGCAINDGFETQRSFSYFQEDGVTTTNVQSQISNEVIAHLINDANSVELTAFTANGFDYQTPDAQTTPLTGQHLNYIAFRFATNPGLKLFDFALPTDGSDYEQSDMAFRPWSGMIFGMPSQDARNVVETNHDVNLGHFVFDIRTGLGGVISSADNLTLAQEKTYNAPEGAFEWLDNVTTSGDRFRTTRRYNTPTGWVMVSEEGVANDILSWGLAFGAPGHGAVFRGNTIVASDPLAFDESPILGSPADVAYLWTGNPGGLVDNLFLFNDAVTGHAINLTNEGEFNFEGNRFDSQWLDGNSPDGNGTPNAALYNGVGQITLNVVGGGNIPTYTDKQSPGTTINANVLVTITNLQPGTEVRVYLAEDFNSPIDTSEISGIENIASPTEFTFSAAAGTVVDIVIHNVDYVLPPNNRIKNFTVPTTTTSFPVTQLPDVNFRNT